MDFIKRILRLFIPFQFLGDAFDPTQPLWERLGNMVVFLGLASLILGLVVAMTAPETIIGKQLISIGSPLVYIASVLMIIFIVLGEIKRASVRTNRKEISNRFISILYGTFVFVLLPCILLTAILMLGFAFL